MMILFEQLPWFIKDEFFLLAIGSNIDLCFLNKQIYNKYAGKNKLLGICFLVPKTKDDIIPKRFRDVKKISFERTNGVNWDILYSCQTIDEICIIINNSIEFPKKLISYCSQFTMVRKLKVEIFSSISQETIYSLLKFSNHTLIELDIETREFDAKDRDTIFNELVFFYLKVFTLHTGRIIQGLKDLKRFMPNLQALKIGSNFSEDNLDTSGFNWPKFQEFDFRPPRHLFFIPLKLDFNNMTSIKRLGLPSEAEIADVCALQIEELSIYFWHDVLTATFRHLRVNKLNLYFNNFKKLDSLVTLTEILSYPKALKVNLINCEEKDWPSGLFPATEVEFETFSYITNDSLAWLSNNFKIKTIRIGVFYNREFPDLNNIWFQDLDYVFIKSLNIEIQKKWSDYFSLERYPNLKLLILREDF